MIYYLLTSLTFLLLCTFICFASIFCFKIFYCSYYFTIIVICFEIDSRINPKIGLEKQDMFRVLKTSSISNKIGKFQVWNLPMLKPIIISKVSCFDISLAKSDPNIFVIWWDQKVQIYGALSNTLFFLDKRSPSNDICSQ